MRGVKPFQGYKYQSGQILSSDGDKKEVDTLIKKKIKKTVKGSDKKK